MNIDPREIERRLARLEECVKRLMQGKIEPDRAGNDKVIVGRDRICKVYGIGRRTFYWLIEEKAPIRQMGGRYFVHRDSLDAFFLEMTVDSDLKVSENKSPAGKGRKNTKRRS